MVIEAILIFATQLVFINVLLNRPPSRVNVDAGAKNVDATETPLVNIKNQIRK